MNQYEQYFSSESIKDYLGGNEKEHLDELQKMISSVWRDVTKIDHACQQGRSDRIQNLVHSLRNEAGCIGVKRNYFERGTNQSWLTDTLLQTMDALFLREDMVALSKLSIEYIEDQNLTVALQKSTQAKEEHNAVPDKQKSCRLALVVDDRPNARRMFEVIIRTLGFNVTSCADGELAVEAMKQKKYDVLLTDLVMPPGDDGGLFVLRAIANNEVDAPRRIILATAHAKLTIPKVEGIDYVTEFKPLSKARIQELIA